MGLLSYTLPNGIVLWGHTGETPGYISAVLSTRDLRRTLTFASTIIGQPTSSQVLDIERGIASAAYDSAGH
jgi:hypothetical protein